MWSPSLRLKKTSWEPTISTSIAMTRRLRNATFMVVWKGSSRIAYCDCNMVLPCIMNYERIMQDMAENCLNLRGREEGSLISSKKVSRAQRMAQLIAERLIGQKPFALLPQFLVLLLMNQ
jgi:hypothetical protein